ncbi:hypothetical protein E1B28_005213 [Marasmius oreades]|nr:uncharacterized protein E1B28_005213 [Marasmius oreades]KAG7097901.1 hypothetical protein E1B28_005213 [Marasmius oreades]
MLNEVIGWNWILITMPYGKSWNTRRKLVHQEFNPKQSERYEPQTVKAVRNLLVDLLREPDNFCHLFRHMAGSIILSITYGITIKPAEIGDPAIDTAERALEGFEAAAVLGSFLVDYLPILKYLPSWFPGASFKLKGREWGKDADRMLNEPFDIVKEQIVNGSNKPCFVSYCLDRKNAKDVDETVVRESAGAMYLAGTDTTVCALHIFILAMVCYPEAQRLAQEELDRVVDPDRLPDLKDRDDLPYITAILYETMRWQPVDPLGLAHLVTEEDEYRGYRIPRNSVVTGNVWAVFRDAEIYGRDTDKFIPGRFLTPDGQINPDIPEPTMFWGTGRRICPGRHFAMISMYAAVAGMLYSFNIRKVRDKFGNEIVPSQEFTSSLQSRPVPFPCEIKPRSEHHEKLIRTAAVLMNDVDI